MCILRILNRSIVIPKKGTFFFPQISQNELGAYCRLVDNLFESIQVVEGQEDGCFVRIHGACHTSHSGKFWRVLNTRWLEAGTANSTCDTDASLAAKSASRSSMVGAVCVRTRLSGCAAEDVLSFSVPTCKPARAASHSCDTCKISGSLQWCVCTKICISSVPGGCTYPSFRSQPLPQNYRCEVGSFRVCASTPLSSRAAGTAKRSEAPHPPFLTMTWDPSPRLA